MALLFFKVTASPPAMLEVVPPLAFHVLRVASVFLSKVVTIYIRNVRPSYRIT